MFYFEAPPLFASWWELPVVFDPIVTKYLPVQVEPANVYLSGRSMVLKDIQTAYTEKIPLTGIEKGGTIAGRIALERQLKLVERQNNKLKIKYTVKQR